MQEVFDILDPYWNYVDYSLLEHIVEKYCDDNLKKQMKKYIEKLHTFEKATSVTELTSVVQVLQTPPKDYSTLTVTLEKDGTKCSLYRARKIKEAITERASLRKYVLLLLNLHASSVVMTIAFPRAVRKYIKRSLDREFLQEVGIIPESIRLDYKHTRSSRRRQIIPVSPHVNEWPTLDQKSVMPDPPQNVTEDFYIVFLLLNIF